jgi:hypothetical protein
MMIGVEWESGRWEVASVFIVFLGQGLQRWPSGAHRRSLNTKAMPIVPLEGARRVDCAWNSDLLDHEAGGRSAHLRDAGACKASRCKIGRSQPTGKLFE